MSLMSSPSSRRICNWCRHDRIFQEWAPGGPPSIPAHCTRTPCSLWQNHLWWPLWLNWGQRWRRHSWHKTQSYIVKKNLNAYNTHAVSYLSEKPGSCVPSGLIRVVVLVKVLVGGRAPKKICKCNLTRKSRNLTHRSTNGLEKISLFIL